MVGAGLSRRLAAVLHVVGRRCQFCAAVLEHADEFPLCRNCRALLPPRVGGYCPDCGICYEDSAIPVYSCLSCRLGKPPWSAVAFHGLYSGALRELIHQHKFNHDHGLGLLLRGLIREAWDRHSLSRPDCIVPVPMLPAKLLDRGFNQSVELARMLGKVIGLPPLLSGLRKTRETMAQSSLGRAERHRNVAGAFEAVASLSGQHVLLVDDVMTTGATLTACAKACLAAKARRVDIFFLGRAV
jgi:ComF family protein